MGKSHAPTFFFAGVQHFVANILAWLFIERPKSSDWTHFYMNCVYDTNPLLASEMPRLHHTQVCISRRCPFKQRLQGNVALHQIEKPYLISDET